MSGNPDWKRGGPSPNPGGRPKVQMDAAKQLARMIHEEARGGLELVEFAFAVYRHPVGPVDVGSDLKSGGALHGLAEVTADEGTVDPKKSRKRGKKDKGDGAAPEGGA